MHLRLTTLLLTSLSFTLSETRNTRSPSFEYRFGFSFVTIYHKALSIRTEFWDNLKDNLIMMRCKDDVEQVCQAADEEGEDGEEVKAGCERKMGNKPGLLLHWEPSSCCFSSLEYSRMF